MNSSKVSIYDKFKKYEVSASSLEDFLERYTKTDRHSGRGEEYVKNRIESHSKDLEKYGYTIITHHSSKTGETVSYYGEQAKGESENV